MVVETPCTVAGVMKSPQLWKPSMLSFVASAEGKLCESGIWKGSVLEKKLAMDWVSTSVRSD